MHMVSDVLCMLLRLLCPLALWLQAGGWFAGVSGGEKASQMAEWWHGSGMHRLGFWWETILKVKGAPRWVPALGPSDPDLCCPSSCPPRGKGCSEPGKGACLELTSSSRPHSRCLGPNVSPPKQPWVYFQSCRSLCWCVLLRVVPVGLQVIQKKVSFRNCGQTLDLPSVMSTRGGVCGEMVQPRVGHQAWEPVHPVTLMFRPRVTESPTSPSIFQVSPKAYL